MAMAADAGRWMAERTIDAQRASATVRVLNPPAAANGIPHRCLLPRTVSSPRLRRERACARPRMHTTPRTPSPASIKLLLLPSTMHPPNTQLPAQVPRDTAQLYAQLAQSGLQYGPAFRLLRNVHVPDSS